MNIRKLQYMCTIADEQNITKAAQKLFVAQPYLSSMITKIEKELDIKIFDRSTSPLQLTSEGELFIAHARHVIDMEHQMKLKLQDVKQLKAGKVSIGCPFSLSTYILPIVLPHFHRLYPNIELELSELLPAEIEQLLVRGLLDVGFTSAEPHETQLSHIPVLRQVFKVATGKDHPFVKKFPDRILSITDLADEQFVSNIPGTRFRISLEQFFADYNLQYNVLLNTKNSETAKALVAQGFGIMFLHETMIVENNNPHQLVYFSTKERAPEFTVSLVTNPQTYTSLAAQKFVDIVCQQLDAIT